MKYGFFEDSRSVFNNVQTSREDAVFLLHGCLLHLQPWIAIVLFGVSWAIDCLVFCFNSLRAVHGISPP